MRKILFTLLVLISPVTVSYAAIETASDVLIGTNIAASNTITVYDPQYTYISGNPSWSSEFTNYKVTNRVTLRYTDALLNYYSAPWQFSVFFTFDRVDETLNNLTQQTCTLTVNYDPAVGVSYRNSQNFQIDLGLFTTVTVTGISKTTGFTAPNDLILESEIITERYYVYDQFAFPTISHTYNSTPNTLTLTWPSMTGAEEYDLEWLFVSQYDATALASPDFSKASRVTLNSGSYDIHVIYDKGTIFYRVRGVGRLGTDFSHRAEGEWSTVTGSTKYVITTTFDASRNWKYEINYAEGGKKKEIVTFFDGSSRSRQGVTKISTDDVAILSESMYDFEGRGVIQTLPAPTISLNSQLQFHTFQTVKSGSTSVLYGPNIFDADAFFTCGSYTSDSLDDSYGASYYYSPNNSTKTIGFNASIPNAKEYPFTQVVYGNDGRVKMQSGPGTDHKIGSNHETKYFYATPLQYKLDQLFGNEVGFNKHYSQKAVMDANGQVSVSYLDLNNKVIATALAGSAPTNMNALTTSVNATIDASIISDNQYSAVDEGYILRTSLLVTNPNTDYIFTYGMTQEQYAATCANTTHNCSYDIVIQVTDDCNQVVNTYPTGTATFSYTVTYSTTFTSTFTIRFPRVGTYTIYKKLTLNQAALQTAVQLFMDSLPGTCITSLSSLQNSYNAVLDSSECLSCLDNCGALADDLGLTGTPRTNFIDSCKNADCVYDTATTTAHCGVLLQIMGMDLSPDGQYFDNIPYGSTSSPANTWFSANITSDGNGTGNWTAMGFYTTSSALITTWADLRSNWVQGWETKTFTSALSGKTQLVQFHPEYCHYSWCVTTDSSQRFDQHIGVHGTYAWATSWPNTTNPYIKTSQAPVGLNLLNADPYFNTLPGSTQYTLMSAYLTDNDLGVPVTSMWTMAGTFAGCTACDDQWKVFKGLYFLRKKQLMDTLNMTSNACYYLYDQTSPPDNVADAVTCTLLVVQPKCNPANTHGFSIRVPDYMDDLKSAVASSTTWNAFANAVSSTTFLCKKRASARLQVTNYSGCTASTVTVAVNVSSTTIVPNFTNLDITGGLCCFQASTTAELVEAIVASINSYVSVPDFTAYVDPTDATKFYVLAPDMYGASGNSINISGTISCTGGSGTISCVSCAPGLTAMTGGQDSVACPTVKDCFCTELAQLSYFYNTTNPETGTYYVSHTTYTTVGAYIVAQLNSTFNPNPAITSTQVSAWLSNCSNNGDTDPETQPGQSPTPVPSAIDCDRGDDCMDDAQSITDYYVEQLYNTAVQNAVNDFIAAYKKECLFGTSFSESFRLQFEDKEHHFTLYYYDQAGNLVRTVPPNGVDKQTSTEVTAVQNHRNNPITYPTGQYPTHTFVTNYKYNTYNKLTQQTTPDAGTTNFFIDKVGRIIASQNAKQAGTTGYYYSYTVYDALGRITEVGQASHPNTALTQTIVESPSSFASWLAASTKTEVTRTYYETVISGTVPGLVQNNLRSRISSVTFEATDDASHTTYDHATHYSYDIHGNVEQLWQENTLITFSGQTIKTMKYRYDLISGNVNGVDYQPGKADQYHHQYVYDGDNRITEVFTSNDSVNWRQDAKYFYHLHGPLARVEVGNEKVQGLDYAYTIMGWIKGVNANTLQMSSDLGKDGVNDATSTGSYIPSMPDMHLNVARDAFGYTLSYFTSDWTPINSTASSLTGNLSSLTFNNSGNNLYNGNIKEMATALMAPNGSSLPQLLHLNASQYRYDQLNRITTMDAYLTSTSYTDYTNAASNGDYSEDYTYDANGNILTLLRKGITGVNQNMDDLAYNYTSGTNKLGYVDDVVTSTNYTTDIDDQSSGNYTYDAIGNLTADVQEQIGTITWSVYGKVLSITRSSGSTKPDLVFKYDAMGNRISKLVKPKTGAGALVASNLWTTTYYLRDAQGNVMATYDQAPNGSDISTFYLKEQYIYGSNRIGVKDTTLDMGTATFPTAYFKDVYGQKEYELSNHLGNVLVVVSDKKLTLDGNTDGFTDYYYPDVLSTQDYYPFGMMMPGRNYNTSSARWGFNGKENDNEVFGSAGTFQDYGMRCYNPRLARFFSVDPIAADYPELTPYQFASNRPIDGVDWDGLEHRRIHALVNSETKSLMKVTDASFTVQTLGPLGWGVEYRFWNEKGEYMGSRFKEEPAPTWWYGAKAGSPLYYKGFPVTFDVSGIPDLDGPGTVGSTSGSYKQTIGVPGFSITLEVGIYSTGENSFGFFGGASRDVGLSTDMFNLPGMSGTGSLKFNSQNEFKVKNELTESTKLKGKAGFSYLGIGVNYEKDIEGGKNTSISVDMGGVGTKVSSSLKYSDKSQWNASEFSIK